MGSSSLAASPLVRSAFGMHKPDNIFALFWVALDYIIIVAWSPDGKTLASGAEDNTIRYWGYTVPDIYYKLLRAILIGFGA